jgi:hypothetical protein
VLLVFAPLASLHADGAGAPPDHSISRARGNARPESDFDVLAVHVGARPIPADAKEGPIIYSIGMMPTGEQIDLLLIPPADWDHPGRFMTDCRAVGVQLR